MYLFYNRKFLEFIKKNPEEITDDDIKEFLASKMSDDSLSNSSIALIKASIKFFYTDMLGKNMSLIKTPKASKKLPVVLSRDEIKNLIDNTENIKHRLLIELLYSTGLRLSECINLQYSDLDLNDGIGWVRLGKGAKDRIFIISELFRKDLLDYMEKTGRWKRIHFFCKWQENVSTRSPACYKSICPARRHRETCACAYAPAFFCNTSS